MRVFSGLACYVVSTLFYLVALKAFDLSFTYPMIAASYAIVVVLSWKVLGEDIPLLRIAAIAVILMGVVILALSYKGNKGEAVSPAAAASVAESTEGDA
ncbi:MAG: hypothetical protein U9Q79_11980 [Candidatus Hydrogenedentes bacterium]|nr:hypothetical protein [Candidatus Hydrogenedentota bacterium]